MIPLTPSQIDQLAMQLKKDHQTLLTEVQQELANSGNQQRIELLNREPGDSGDESMASALADFNLTVLDRHVHALRDIESAFKRIKDETYGVCVDCGDSVGFARLQVYPTAMRCNVCQEKYEREYAPGGYASM